MQIAISTSGEIKFIHQDELAQELRGEGKITIRRASHVEPTENGEWTAEMVDGPTLGPFPTRQEALAAEVAFLENKLFGE